MTDHDVVAFGSNPEVEPQNRWRLECRCEALFFGPTLPAARFAHEDHWRNETIGKAGVAAAKAALEGKESGGPHP